MPANATRVARSAIEAPAPVFPLSHSEALLATTTNIEPVARATIKLSDEQLAIATHVRDGAGNLLVQARAGTGKTYLILQCLPLMRGEIAIAAYNRKIAREIRKKVALAGLSVRNFAEAQAKRKGIDVDTFHAYGWRTLRQSLKGVRIEGFSGKDAPGFLKFPFIAERLSIPESLHTVVRRAMNIGQEHLLEIKRDTSADLIAAADARKAIAQAFLDGLVAFEKPAYREMATSIARMHSERGYITERQHVSVKMSARNAKQRIPAELIVGFDNLPVLPTKTDTVATDGLDPRWIELAEHHALELDLPADDHIEMQLLAQAQPTLGMSEIRDRLLRKALGLAAKAIHLSAQMATEKFREIRSIKGREIEGVEFTGIVSFNEMLYLPIYYDLAIAQYDWVCVDEAQDSNPARREFARRMLKDSGRFFWVGDDRQAIYGWAGADNDALDIIVETFGCRILPMTTTFRCGKAIVELAKQIVPDYRAADTNPAGVVSSIDEAAFNKMELLPTDAVICRNTAPLVKVAYKLIARGISCYVEGRDIGKRLLPLLYRWNNITNVVTYTERLKEYCDAEAAKLGDKPEAIEELHERVQTILAIIEFLPKGSKVADIRTHVEAMFQDSPEDAEPTKVSLMTIHRSKGLEFNRVFGLGVNKYLPSPFAAKEWQKLQEENLEYVLKTRAINEYVDVAVV